MRKLSILLLLGLFIFSGCIITKAKISQSVLKEKSLTPVVSSEDIPLVIVGFKLLKDKRPKKDITYMASVIENVSAKILESLQDTQLFNQINFPPSESDNVVISGEIRKFSWRSFETMISYIPGLNVFNLFGLPSTRTHTEVEIYLEVKDIKSGQVILNFKETYAKSNKYNIYNFKSSKANEELSYGFGVVLDKIKQRFITKKSAILEAAKTMPPPTPESEEIEESPQVSDSQDSGEEITEEIAEEIIEEAIEESITEAEQK